MPHLFFFICLLAILNSCTTQEKQAFEYMPLKSFTNDTSSIQPNTKVRILAFSGSMDNNTDAIYYSQILVVNEINGDTLSILCPALKVPSYESQLNGILIMPTQYDPKKNITEALYQRSDSSVISVLQISAEVEKMPITNDTTEDMSKYLSGAILKKELVAVNKTMSIFARHYRTVIGILEFSSNVGI